MRTSLIRPSVPTGPKGGFVFLVAGLALVNAAAAPSQQPNGPLASMTIDGATGPGPIATTVRTSTAAVFSLAGTPGAPLLIGQSATGVVSPGWITTGGGTVDLPLSPPPAIVADGFADPAFTLGTAGTLVFAVGVPAAGVPPAGIPLGHQEAVQAAIADPTSPTGFRLTAATQVTVVQGPTVVNLNLGSDGAVSIDVGAHGFQIPYYGVAYNSLWVCVNGFITFGSPDTDFTASILEFNGSHPRVAPMWSDLEQVGPGQVVRYTIDPAPPNAQPPFVRVEWINVQDFAVPLLHTFSAYLDAAGTCRISHSLTTSASLYDTIVGIGPGLGQNPQASKDLSAIKAAGGAFGGFKESFFELFPGGTPSSFDLFGLTLDFVPTGSGTPPASTASYAFN
jgi:hypothetical protein